MTDLSKLNSLEKIAEAGEQIYEADHKTRLEAESRGKFVAIDVTTRNAYVDDDSGRALEKARAQAPAGIFHLIRIGESAAVRGGYYLTHGYQQPSA